MKKPAALVRTLFAGLGLAVLFAGNLALGQSNLVLLVSSPGEPIAQGRSYATTNLADVGVAILETYGLSIWANNTHGHYEIYASGSNGVPPGIGDYENVGWDPFSGSSPGLNVTGNGIGCGGVCGNFHVYEFETNGAGVVTRLWLTFTQYCECATAPLAGEVRYHSQLASDTLPSPSVLNVPREYASIQAAIDAASPLVRATVLVTNGLYHENLDFGGKAVTVTSVNGPLVTVIDGSSAGAVVNFSSGETSNSTIAGFTITNGGISVAFSSPTIISNTIVNGGVNSYFGSPNVLDNFITGCSGAAVYLGGAGTALIQGNIMQNNGAGIGMLSSGLPNIVANFIQSNQGDGIGMDNYCDANIVQNVIIDNSGNGIGAAGIGGSRGPWIINNTIAGNAGSGIAELTAAPSSGEVINNIVVGNPALTISTYGGFENDPPIMQFNDFYSTTGNVYTGGVVTNLDIIDGNISADPGFSCQHDGDYHLLAGSPCIDAGTNGAPYLPAVDVDGNPRLLAGNSNNVPTVDMGAYEFNPLYPPIPCMFVNCQTDRVVYTAPGQNSTVVNFPTPTGTPVATITCSPPSGSTFFGGTNVVTCTATYGTNSASCAFNVIVVVAPTIRQPPQSLQVAAGKAFTLSVGVTGSWPIRYQWRYQGNAIPGANAATLTITDAQAVNDGVYSVLVSNDAGATNSSLARVRVLPAKPAIVSNPVSLVVAASDPAVFNVVATGSEPFTYQWFFNQHALSGATAAQLSLATVQSAQGGAYYVVVSGLAGQATSRSATLTVRPVAPHFVVQPVSATLLFGLPLTLSAQASGSLPMQYQWSFQGQPLRNQTGAQLRLPSVTAASAGNYSVVASNPYGRTTSTPAQVTVNIPPQPLRLLKSQVVKAGQKITLAFAASGSGALTYSWQFNGTPITCANPILTLTNIQAPQAGYYQVTAANAFGSYSSAAKISLIGPSSRLVAWGDNSNGQTNVPAGLNNVVAAAGGDFYSIAVRADGSLVAWGDNSDGQKNIPAHLPPIVAIAAGAGHNLAIGVDGSIRAWGNNASGQCDLPAAAADQPLAVAGGDAHSLALLANGMVTAWGDDTYGQTDLPDALTPIYSSWWWSWPNPNWVPAATITAGRNHNLAILTNGGVVAWGDDSGGQCEIPTGLTNVIAVAGGYLHSVALRADGTVLAWGDNTYGQTNIPLGLTNVVSIAAGDFNTLALLANGRVVGWGDNSYGQNKIPAGVTNVAGIVSGYDHGLALIPAAH